MGGVVDQGHAPGALPPGKETRYPYIGGWVGPQYRRGWVQKISQPPGFHPQITSP